MADATARAESGSSDERTWYTAGPTVHSAAAVSELPADGLPGTTTETRPPLSAWGSSGTNSAARWSASAVEGVVPSRVSTCTDQAPTLQSMAAPSMVGQVVAAVPFESTSGDDAPPQATIDCRLAWARADAAFDVDAVGVVEKLASSLPASADESMGLSTATGWGVTMRVTLSWPPSPPVWAVT